MLGDLYRRLRHIEARTPTTCRACATWTIRVEMPGEMPSDYELEQRQRRLERDGPGPREWPPQCPDCGRTIPGVVLAYDDGWPPAPNSLAAHLLGMELEP